MSLYRLREASGLLMIVASLIAIPDPSDKGTIEGDTECGSGNQLSASALPSGELGVGRASGLIANASARGKQHSSIEKHSHSRDAM